MTDLGPIHYRDGVPSEWQPWDLELEHQDNLRLAAAESLDAIEARGGPDFYFDLNDDIPF